MTPDDPEDEPVWEDDPPGEPPDEDEVPPARFVKIEDFAPALDTVGDAVSPLENVNGSNLAQPNAVAVARVSGEDEDGVFVGETLAEMAFVIGELGGRQGAVLIEDLALANSFTIAFKTGAPAEVPELRSPASRELNGAALLMQALSSSTAHDLLRALAGKDRTVAPRLEALLRLLFEHRATLDIQTPRAKPIRVTYKRAAALYHALREPIETPDETFIRLGRLTGAYFDTRQFRLRLSEPWRRRRVIEGKFPEEIATAVHALVDAEVMATVSARHDRRRAHDDTITYTLVSVSEPPRLPERLS